MIINFFPDGTIQHTLKDDVFKMPGHRTIERVSDIRFDQRLQKFYIHWLKGPFTDRAQNIAMALAYGIDGKWARAEPLNVLLFPSYDLAVKFEVKMLDAMRLRGEKF